MIFTLRSVLLVPHYVHQSAYPVVCKHGGWARIHKPLTALLCTILQWAEIQKKTFKNWSLFCREVQFYLYNHNMLNATPIILKTSSLLDLLTAAIWENQTVELLKLKTTNHIQKWNWLSERPPHTAHQTTMVLVKLDNQFWVKIRLNLYNVCPKSMFST